MPASTVRGYDPESMEQARPLMPNVEFCAGPYAAAEGADAVVLVTEWDALRALDLDRLAAAMRGRCCVDLRNVYPPEEVEEAGLAWHGIGRPPRPTAGRAHHDREPFWRSLQPLAAAPAAPAADPLPSAPPRA